tara:strand:- start:100 stop:390 length:291 start_codon:yes stop_codon:yes gene_type:complete
MSQVKATKEKKPLNWSFYFAFVVATIAITKFFTSHKYFTEGNSGIGYTVLALSLVFFILSSLFMAFEIYAEEKDKDNLRVEYPLFENFYKRFKTKK